MSFNSPFGSDFGKLDARFDRNLRTAKRAGVGIGCFALLWALFGLALTCGVVYAAIHFIGKYW